LTFKIQGGTIEKICKKAKGEVSALKAVLQKPCIRNDLQCRSRKRSVFISFPLTFGTGDALFKKAAGIFIFEYAV